MQVQPGAEGLDLAHPARPPAVAGFSRSPASVITRPATRCFFVWSARPSATSRPSLSTTIRLASVSASSR